MNLEDNDFDIFGVPQRQAQDIALIDARWRELQASVHPDRFAVEGGGAQRVAMQWAVRVNEAHDRLKDPLTRAAYLCELNGVSTGERTSMPKQFLQEQIKKHEMLSNAKGMDEVKTLADKVNGQRETLLRQIETTLDERHDYIGASEKVRALMFVERFLADVDQRLAALGQ